MADVSRFLGGVGSVDFCQVGLSPDVPRFWGGEGVVDFCQVGASDVARFLEGVGSSDLEGVSNLTCILGVWYLLTFLVYLQQQLWHNSCLKKSHWPLLEERSGWVPRLQRGIRLVPVHMTKMASLFNFTRQLTLKGISWIKVPWQANLTAQADGISGYAAKIGLSMTDARARMWNCRA